MIEKIEETYGAAMTYTASAALVGVGHWVGENWFLILSAIAVTIRIGIDLPRLYDAWCKRRKK